jgi:hypothetical protein
LQQLCNGFIFLLPSAVYNSAIAHGGDRQQRTGGKANWYNVKYFTVERISISI